MDNPRAELTRNWDVQGSYTDLWLPITKGYRSAHV